MPPITPEDLDEILRRPGYRIAKDSAPQAKRPTPLSTATGPAILSDNQKQIALAMPEEELQQSIIEQAHLYRWQVAHFRSVKVTRKDGSTFWQTPVAADGEGFPDLVLARDNPGGGIGRVLFVECKKETEKPRPTQTKWLSLLILTKRVEVYVWRPSSWLDGTVEALLR